MILAILGDFDPKYVASKIRCRRIVIILLLVNRMLKETSRLESVFYVVAKYFGRLPEAVELSEVERF